MRAQGGDVHLESRAEGGCWRATVVLPDAHGPRASVHGAIAGLRRAAWRPEGRMLSAPYAVMQFACVPGRRRRGRAGWIGPPERRLDLLR